MIPALRAARADGGGLGGFRPRSGFWRPITRTAFHAATRSHSATGWPELQDAHARSQRGEGTLAYDLALCRRGDEAPFQELTRSAGLRNPFEAGRLRDVAALAREEPERER